MERKNKIETTIETYTVLHCYLCCSLANVHVPRHVGRLSLNPVIHYRASLLIGAIITPGCIHRVTKLYASASPIVLGARVVSRLYLLDALVARTSWVYTFV